MTNTAIGFMSEGPSGIIDNAYKALQNVETVRSDLMSDLKTASGPTGSKIITIGATDSIDISTGAGAMVLDSYLQELSTVEQAAAQVVAQHNKAQKTVHSQTGQA